MAGRLKEIINNKFYFVLDEVGASDCSESDLCSEPSAKESGNTAPEEASSVRHHERNKNAAVDGEDDNSFKNKHFHFSNLSSGTQNEKKNLKNEDCQGVENKNTLPSNSADSVQIPEGDDTVNLEVDSSDVKYNKQNEKEIEPLVRITFRDYAAEKLLKSSLTKFFNQRVEEFIVKTSSSPKPQLEVYEKDSIKFLKNNLLSFDFDTTPTHGNHREVPHYGKINDFVLSDKSVEESEDSKVFASSKRTCFNCLKSHNLKDCPEVKDFRVINKNRALFQNEMKMSKTSRYHLNEAQRFSDIKPGVISKKLRAALNLHGDQVPNFIYRMRLLGYPPAWLEEAKVSHSGVAMYDSSGHLVLEDDEEEGEIIAEGSKDKYDITKIIEFPGFNVPLPGNFKDEAKFYKYPEMSEEQSKQSLINMLKPKTVQAYVKKSMADVKGKDNVENNLKRTSSPTIEEMEEKKRQLLMELDDEESSSRSKVNLDDSPSGAGTGTTAAETETFEGFAQSLKEPGSVRHSEFGTPILKSFSPFSKLPAREQFSVNVSDVINFENLPNSTGKYETMRHVITKIRTSVSKAQTK